MRKKIQDNEKTLKQLQSSQENSKDKSGGKRCEEAIKLILELRGLREMDKLRQNFIHDLKAALLGGSYSARHELK